MKDWCENLLLRKMEGLSFSKVLIIKNSIESCCLLNQNSVLCFRIPWNLSMKKNTEYVVSLTIIIVFQNCGGFLSLLFDKSIDGGKDQNYY